jgi:hypothetical protein
MNTLRFFRLGFAAISGLFLFSAAAPTAEADIILYGSSGGDNSSGGGRLYLINVTTQIVTPIGNTGFDRLGGIAFNSSGVLYGAAGGSAAQTTLLTIDPMTGAASVVGLVSDPTTAIDSLRFNAQGVLYGGAYQNNASVGVLVTLNSANANILSSLTLVGSGNSFCPGIGFNAAGVLYGSRGNSSGRAEDLDLINQATGALTSIGGMEAIISDIVFDATDTLYGSSPNGNLYSINPITGAKTLLFNTGITQFAGLAAPVPEPSVAVLFVIAALALVLVRWRVKRSSP